MANLCVFVLCVCVCLLLCVSCLVGVCWGVGSRARKRATAVLRQKNIAGRKPSTLRRTMADCEPLRVSVQEASSSSFPRTGSSRDEVLLPLRDLLWRDAPTGLSSWNDRKVLDSHLDLQLLRFSPRPLPWESQNACLQKSDAGYVS